MLLGAVTYNVLKDWDLETIIKNLEAAGFEAVELRTGHKHGVEISRRLAGGCTDCMADSITASISRKLVRCRAKAILRFRGKEIFGDSDARRRS